MGSRLYRYFKANILGFTSWYIFPYWAAAGLYFYGFWQLIEYLIPDSKINKIDSISMVRDLSLVALLAFFLVLLFLGIRDYSRRKISNLLGFRWSKYFLLVSVIWIPIIYMVLVLSNYYILIYFILTSITGLILEGLLSMKLRDVYGESFWLYYRYNIFKQGTSLLILHVWGAASLLAFLLFNIFLI